MALLAGSAFGQTADVKPCMLTLEQAPSWFGVTLGDTVESVAKGRDGFMDRYKDGVRQMEELGMEAMIDMPKVAATDETSLSLTFLRGKVAAVSIRYIKREPADPAAFRAEMSKAYGLPANAWSFKMPLNALMEYKGFNVNISTGIKDTELANPGIGILDPPFGGSISIHPPIVTVQ